MSTERASTAHENVIAQSTRFAHLSGAPSLRAHQGTARTEPVSAHDRQSASRSAVRRLMAVIAVLGGALAVGAFTLSFDALRELAIISGLNPTLAWLWPLIVDGFILIATAAAVALRGRRRSTWYPWATLVLFSAISVAGNALHASNHADHTAVSVTVAAGVSAVPALALLLASHLLVVLLSTPNHTADEPSPAAGHQEAPQRAAVTPTHSAARTARAATSADPSSVTMPTSTTKTATPPRSTVDDDLRAWLHAEHAAGRTVTGSDVATRLNVSPATGRRRLAALRHEQSAEAPNNSPQA